MLLYLVRHGKAKSEAEDLLRPLSEKGFQEISRTASYLARLNISVNQIFHSGKLRAKQTAEVLSGNLKPINGTLETEGLAPSDDPSIWAERLDEIADPIMLVGHLPHLEKLTTLLLTGKPDKDIVSLKTGGIICLTKDNSGNWVLQWMITPEMVI
jgi:phosphohistidine phosphatase